MSNWLYATKTPTEKWRSAMTLPRILSLQKKGITYQLHSQVAPQMQLDKINGYDNKNISVATNSPFSIQYNGGFNGLNQTKITFLAQPVDFRLVLENEN
jgi:fructan beta-fructosidase